MISEGEYLSTLICWRQPDKFGILIRTMKDAILIVGGACVIGSHLCEYFYKDVQAHEYFKKRVIFPRT